MVPGKTTSFGFLWKGYFFTPTEELGKLYKFTEYYASDTIEKAVEVQELLKDKEDNITVMEKTFNAETEIVLNSGRKN